MTKDKGQLKKQSLFFLNSEFWQRVFPLGAGLPTFLAASRNIGKPAPTNRSRTLKEGKILPFLMVTFCWGAYSSAAILLTQRFAIAEGIPIGVVRSPENATQWGGITARLNESGIAYCVVDLQTVQSDADLTGPAILFLPNVEKLNQEQAIALETWLKKGGRVIVSGPVGSLSTPAVRQQLRSLLGAYWAFPLPEPTMLKPMRTNTLSWVPRELAGTVHGGVVIPTGLNSQTAATWNSPDNPPAVITTNRSTFLGWRWGVNTAAGASFDLGWLKAALNRYGNVAQTSSINTQTPGNCLPSNVASRLYTNTTRSLVQPTVIRSPYPETDRMSRGLESREPLVALPNPPVPPVSPAPLPIPKGQTLIPNSRAIPLLNPTAEPDPTERIATGTIPLTPNAAIISASEAIAMRQELENLMGRVESALLAANATNSTSAISDEQRGLGSGGRRGAGEKKEASDISTLASSSPPTSVASTSLVSTQNSPSGTLQATREVLQSFPQLIARGDYGGARQQWLQARQNLLNLYPIDRPNAQPEIRAIWLDRGSIIQAGSEKGLARIFDLLAPAGINTVFFETVNAGYSIYPSQVAPEQNPLTKGWDPLAVAVKLAHSRGIELHAWVWTFAIGNQRHNQILNQPPNYLGPVLAAHPDWANYDNRGNIIPQDQTKPFLDPANPEVRRYLLNLFEEIVRRYQVDGLQLDYIRYPFQDPSAGRTYGYGQAARQQFQQLAGIDPLQISPRDNNLWQKWTEFRTNQINTFVAEVSQNLRQLRPNLILSVAVFPYPESERIQKLQQNWEIWTRRGDVDLVVPMAYAADTNRFQQLIQPWLTRTDLGASLISPGIQLLSLPEIAAVDQIQLVRDLPSGGYSLFALEHLSTALQRILSRTQTTGQLNAKQPIPYRQPFATALARYTALRQEWNFLLETNQLQLPESARSSWRSRSEGLFTALNRLASSPTRENLTAAQKSLTAFRFWFGEWMRPHSTQHSYQVQTWENRLASLERLLSYGERILLHQASNTGVNSSAPTPK